MLALQDAKQNVAAVEKLRGGLGSLADLYLLSTFRLPPKLGGVLLGVYSKQDSRKLLEVAVMGKINKGWGLGWDRGSVGGTVRTAWKLLKVLKVLESLTSVSSSVVLAAAGFPPELLPQTSWSPKQTGTFSRNRHHQ